MVSIADLILQSRNDSLNQGLAAASAALLAPPTVGAPNPRGGLGNALNAFSQSISSGRQNALQQALALRQLQLQEGAQTRLAAKDKRAAQKDRRTVEGNLKARAFLFGDETETEEGAGLLNSGVFTGEQKTALTALAQTDPKAAANGALKVLSDKGIAPITRNVDGRVKMFDRSGKLIADLGKSDDSGLTAIADAFTKTLDTKEAGQTADARLDAGTALAIARATKNMLSDLQKSDGGTVSLTAVLSKAGAAVKNEARQIARKFNVSTDATDYDFGTLAGESSAFKSSALNLAVMTARAQQGARLSDRDVQDALTRVGGSARSPEVAKAALIRNLQETVGLIEDRISTTVPSDAQTGILSPGFLRKRIEKRLGRFSGILTQEAPPVLDSLSSQPPQSQIKIRRIR